MRCGVRSLVAVVTSTWRSAWWFSTPYSPPRGAKSLVKVSALYMYVCMWWRVLLRIGSVCDNIYVCKASVHACVLLMCMSICTHTYHNCLICLTLTYLLYSIYACRPAAQRAQGRPPLPRPARGPGTQVCNPSYSMHCIIGMVAYSLLDCCAVYVCLHTYIFSVLYGYGMSRVRLLCFCVYFHTLYFVFSTHFIISICMQYIGLQ